MSAKQTVALLTVGVALAAWWTGRTGDPSAAGFRVPGAGPGGTDLTVDWGELADQFRVRNPRVEVRSDAVVGRRPTRVVVFEVEAREEDWGRVYVAEGVDAAGVPVPANFWPGPVVFEPDLGMQGTFRWEAGSKSRGWFLLPDPAGGANPTARVAVRRFRN